MDRDDAGAALPRRRSAVPRRIPVAPAAPAGSMTRYLDKLGSFGSVVAAAACPICFPKLALLGSLIGLGAFSAYEAQLFIAAQLLVIVAVAGQAVAYRQHRNAWLLGAAFVSGAAVFA